MMIIKMSEPVFPLVDLLFLDIDGVFNGRPLPKRIFIEQYQDYVTPFREESVLAFNKLLAHAAALEAQGHPPLKVVVSSSWKVGNTPERLEGIFRILGLNLANKQVIAKTPNVEATSHRGQEIAASLDELSKRFAIRSYICVDDCCGECIAPHQERTVCTGGFRNEPCFSESHTSQALQLLYGHSF